jgi:hypothetical protein
MLGLKSRILSLRSPFTSGAGSGWEELGETRTGMASHGCVKEKALTLHRLRRPATIIDPRVALVFLARSIHNPEVKVW